jgi:ABC-2 type transport system ATP-binding protein
MRADEYVIECHGLTKKFGNFTAVNSIELKVKSGEIFGFLGPNGAGKTTTIKMLTTLLTPTKGEARVASYDVRTQAPLIRSSIGIVPQEFSLFGELTPLENMWYIGELYGMKGDIVRSRSEELLKVVQLYDKRDVPSEGFSGGMKQRLSVAAGLLHTPQILFMDEPTTGLDPQSRIALRELTKKLNETGITIVYTTHDMEEADKLCDRIAIMDLGKIIAVGTSEELKHEYGGGHLIEITVDHYDRALPPELKRMVNADSVEMHNDTIRLHVKHSAGVLVPPLSRFLEKKGINIKDIKTLEPSLEAVFINSTKKNTGD